MPCAEAVQVPPRSCATGPIMGLESLGAGSVPAPPLLVPAAVDPQRQGPAPGAQGQAGGITAALRSKGFKHEGCGRETPRACSSSPRPRALSSQQELLQRKQLHSLLGWDVGSGVGDFTPLLCFSCVGVFGRVGPLQEQDCSVAGDFLLIEGFVTLSDTIRSL